MVMKRVFFSLIVCSLVVLGCDSANPEPGPPPPSFRARLSAPVDATLRGSAVIGEADFSVQNAFVWPLPNAEESITSIQLIDDDPASDRLDFIGLSQIGPDGPSPGAFRAGSFLTCLQGDPSGCLFTNLDRLFLAEYVRVTADSLAIYPMQSGEVVVDAVTDDAIRGTFSLSTSLAFRIGTAAIDTSVTWDDDFQEYGPSIPFDTLATPLTIEGQFTATRGELATPLLGTEL